MAKCLYCDKEAITISRTLGVCVDCLRRDFGKGRSQVEKVQANSRKRFGLPASPRQG